MHGGYARFSLSRIDTSGVLRHIRPLAIENFCARDRDENLRNLVFLREVPCKRTWEFCDQAFNPFCLLLDDGGIYGAVDSLCHSSVLYV